MENFIFCVNNYFIIDFKIKTALTIQLSDSVILISGGDVRRYSFKKCTAWKVSVFGICLVRIFPHLDSIWRDPPYLSVFSPNAVKYWYGLFSCSKKFLVREERRLTVCRTFHPRWQVLSALLITFLSTTH